MGGILENGGGGTVLAKATAGIRGLCEFSRLMREVLSSEAWSRGGSTNPVTGRLCLVSSSASAVLTLSETSEDMEWASELMALSPAYTACALKLSPGRPANHKRSHSAFAHTVKNGCPLG